MTTRIMPVGASNTYGLYTDLTSPGGYRGPLQYMLQGAGVDCDFVGLDRDGAIADPDHNGYSGKTIEWFTRPVNEAIYDPKSGAFSHHIDTGGKPAIHYFIEQAGMTSADVVLLLAGTNNVIAGDSAETMLAKMAVLLDMIVSHPSSPEVRVMKLQPVGGDWWQDNDPTRTNNDTIRIFNEGLDTLVKERFAERGVEVVDMGATEADLHRDGVHLSEDGFRKAAAAWFDSLMDHDELRFHSERPELPETQARESAAPVQFWTGGKGADRFTGTAANERIDGGAGGDTMAGRGGDDTYFVDHRNDRVIEEAGGGIDTVRTTLTSYRAPDHVENVVLETTSRATLTGNQLDNILRGGSGADTIDGGAGADVLFGEGGADTFVFRKGEAHGDRVGDFGGGDILQFSGYGKGAVLVGLGAGSWSISFNGGVEVIEVLGTGGALAQLVENSDYFFV